MKTLLPLFCFLTQGWSTISTSPKKSMPLLYNDWVWNWLLLVQVHSPACLSSVELLFTLLISRLDAKPGQGWNSMCILQCHSYIWGLPLNSRSLAQLAYIYSRNTYTLGICFRSDLWIYFKYIILYTLGSKSHRRQWKLSSCIKLHNLWTQYFSSAY